MIKRSFFGLQKPRFEYDVIKASPDEIQDITPSKKVQLFIHATFDQTNQVMLKSGDEVKTGQKLTLFENKDAYCISGVTGKIAEISPYIGDFGQEMTSIMIGLSSTMENDTQFKEITESPSLANSLIVWVPGNIRHHFMGSRSLCIHNFKRKFCK